MIVQCLFGVPPPSDEMKRTSINNRSWHLGSLHPGLDVSSHVSHSQCLSWSGHLQPLLQLCGCSIHHMRERRHLSEMSRRTIPQPLCTSTDIEVQRISVTISWTSPFIIFIRTTRLAVIRLWWRLALGTIIRPVLQLDLSTKLFRTLWTFHSLDEVSPMIVLSYCPTLGVSSRDGDVACRGEASHFHLIP